MLDHYALKQANFQINITEGIKALRQNPDLSDVTLVVEDGGRIFAHKIVLAMSSSFFNEILTENNMNNSPSIFLRGSRIETVVFLLDFIYNGTVTVDAGNLKEFLELASDLKIKGLENHLKTEVIATDIVKAKNTSKKSMKKEITSDELVVGTFVTSDDQISKLDLLISSKMEKTSKQKSWHPGQPQGDEAKSEGTKEENVGGLGKNVRNEWKCKDCGKTGMKANIVTHVEGIHVSGFLHPCFMCGVSFR